MNKSILTALLLTFAIPCFAATNTVNTVAQSKTSDKTEISTADAKKVLNKSNYVFVDVREKSEYDEGHIKGVKLIPLGNISTDALKLDKKAKYITVCHSGRRSKKAAEEMKKMGLNAVSMTGGMVDWKEKGYPVSK